MLKILIIIVFLLVILNIIFAELWFKFPANIFGLKYNIVSDLKLENLNQGPYLFIVDHKGPIRTDIMIFSQEVHNLNNDIKFNFFSQKCENKYNYFYYRTKYKIIEKTKKSVDKSINILKNKENLVFFLKPEAEGKGIYYILKETKVPIVYVRKKLLNKIENKNLSNNYLNWRNLKYDIEYELDNNYPLEKTPEKFMEYIKNKLFKK